jgi:hypothetical protein
VDLLRCERNASVLRERSGAGWGTFPTPLPLGFPGWVIVAKPVDPTGQRSRKCQALDVPGELV